jgi:hypothetical protein
LVVSNAADVNLSSKINCEAVYPAGGDKELSGAEQELLVPPLTPSQVQLKVPAPVTADDVPLSQRSTEGALEIATPAATPHAPLIAFTDACTPDD